MSVKEIVEKAASPSIRHQLGKLLVATMAGFIATKMAENAYDKFTSNDTETIED